MPTQGKMKRYWGAYGNKPDDTPLPPYDPAAPPAQQFCNPVHCADMSVDRLIYVCDRVGDRLQVFTPEGKFVKEQFYEKNTLNAGSVWDIAFSKDAQQKYIFMADGVNEKVKIIDRQTLQELTTFGDGGRQPGQFYGVHSIAIDSKGNLYTTETYEGKRLQKFVYKGMAAGDEGQPGRGLAVTRHAVDESGHRSATSKARLKMRKLARNRTVIVGASLLGLLVVLGIAERVLERTAAAQSKAAVQAPRFEVDPLWPKPMPNHWVLGQTIGVWVDTDDHVWIVHRSSATLADNEKGIEKKTAELCCAGAPPVLEFDQAGNLLRHWGGPGAGARTSGPTATTASSSTTRATSGLAATARPIRTS